MKLVLNKRFPDTDDHYNESLICMTDLCLPLSEQKQEMTCTQGDTQPAGYPRVVCLPQADPPHPALSKKTKTNESNIIKSQQNILVTQCNFSILFVFFMSYNDKCCIFAQSSSLSFTIRAPGHIPINEIVEKIIGLEKCYIKLLVQYSGQ